MKIKLNGGIYILILDDLYYFISARKYFKSSSIKSHILSPYNRVLMTSAKGFF